MVAGNDCFTRGSWWKMPEQNKISSITRPENFELLRSRQIVPLIHKAGSALSSLFSCSYSVISQATAAIPLIKQNHAERLMLFSRGLEQSITVSSYDGSNSISPSRNRSGPNRSGCRQTVVGDVVATVSNGCDHDFGAHGTGIWRASPVCVLEVEGKATRA